MNRAQIKKNVGKVVAYTDRDGNILPAKILDARLWERTKGPEPHVQISSETRAISHASYQVGYPVLMPLRGVHTTPQQRANLEKWLADTVITMDDLFDEQGDQRNPARWAEIEGTFFRVVFPASIRENLPGLRREKAARDRQQFAEMKAARLAYESRQKAAADLNNTLVKLGYTSPDSLPIVTPYGASDDRMSVPASVLDELLRAALPYLAGCDGCGAHDHLLPLDDLERGPLMLCATCHPQVSM